MKLNWLLITALTLSSAPVWGVDLKFCREIVRSYSALLEDPVSLAVQRRATSWDRTRQREGRSPSRALARQLAVDIVDQRTIDRRRSGQVVGDQYFTMGDWPVERALENTSVRGMTVFDFGAGTGIVTSAVEAAQPRKIIAWEVDPPALAALQHTTQRATTEVRSSSFLDEGVDWQGMIRQAGGVQNVAVIANPPYFAIPRIAEIIRTQGIQDVILYMPSWRLSEFPASEGWRVIAELGADDFYPHAPSAQTEGREARTTGNHIVVARGRFAR